MPPRATPFTATPYVRGGNLGELIRQRGRSASEAEYRHGEIQARMYADLGQQISSGIMGYVKDRQEAPIRAQDAKARDLNIQQAEGALAAQQRDTRATTTQNALMPLALKTGEDGIATFDEDLLTREFTTAGIADRLPNVLKSLGDFRTSALQFKKLQGDMQAAQVDTIANLAFGALEAGGTMAAAQRAIELLDANGIVSKDEAAKALEGVTDDASMQARLMEIAKSSPGVRQEMEGRRQRQATEALTRQTAVATAADRVEDNRRLDTTAAEAARHNRAMESAAQQRPQGPQPTWQWVNRAGKEVYTNRVEPDDKPQSARIKATEDERKTAGFFGQMSDAITIIDEIESQLSEKEMYQIQTLPQEGLVGMANRGDLSEPAKRYLRAFEQFTESRLRPVSGAAINDSEYARDRRTYAKQFSETPKLSADRQAARKRALDSLRKRAGTALDEGSDTATPPAGGDGWTTVNGIRIRQRAP